MKFHLLSDLHINQSNPFCLHDVHQKDCDYLILAGDIVDPVSKHFHKLLEEASKLYKVTFYVKGNHECYGRSVEDTDNLIDNACRKYDNIVYLQKNHYDLDSDIRIVGTTLWSCIQEDEMSVARIFISDFRCIKDGWSVESNNYTHMQEVMYLKKEIDMALKERKHLVIVTHHAPYVKGTSHPMHADNSFGSVFATDLSDLFLNPPIKVWAFGHTHYSFDQEIKGVRLVSNQRGMVDEKEMSKFNANFKFEV